MKQDFIAAFEQARDSPMRIQCLENRKSKEKLHIVF